MKTSLFIILPYPSHYNASFGLARELQQRGFRVVFTGSPNLRNHVERQGYEFCNLNYTTEYNIQTVKGFFAFFLRSLLDKKEVKKRYRAWYKSIIEIRRIHEQYQPTRIFLDAHLSHYYLFLIEHNKSITVLSTKLSTKKSPGIPPLNSFYIPTTTTLSRLICEFLWMIETAKTNLNRVKNRVAFLGNDEVYFQRRLCQNHNLRWEAIFEKRNTFFIGLKNVPTIILGTEKLEFPQRKTLPHEQYIYLPIRRNEEKYFTDKYIMVRKKIETLKKQAKCPIIYCSFGTLGSLNFKNVSNFISKLIDAVHRQENLILVISIGNSNLEFRPGSDRIFLLTQVPQLDMLSLSDVMITHGGHNSIKECLQASVPMLVYPLNKKVDQPGNAVRVYTNGYGFWGDIEKDSSTEILAKLSKIRETKDFCKKLDLSDDVNQSLETLYPSFFGRQTSNRVRQS